MEELSNLRELNLAYQLKLTKMEQEYKNLEDSKSQLEHRVTQYVEKEKAEQVRTKTYAELRESWDKLSSHFLDKRAKNIELQRQLFDSRKELAHVKYQLEEAQNTNKELEKQLEFINEMSRSPDCSKKTSPLSSGFLVSTEGITEKCLDKGSVGIRPLQNRLLENVRRHNRKSQSLESLSKVGRRAMGASVETKPGQNSSNSTALNKVTKIRKQVLQPKIPHCGAGSARDAIPVRYPCGINNSQISNRSVTSFNKSVSIPGKPQSGLVPQNPIKSKRFML